ncbi:MAG: DUF1016 N-terminal domain-containing protein [Clostridiales bacterium]|nr:DUF1016 N-terminal domain-containing protein [Clostridiales bacterium]
MDKRGISAKDVQEYLNLASVQSVYNYKNEIVTPLVTQISWTNHLLIMSRCKSNEEREFNIRLSIKENYSNDYLHSFPESIRISLASSSAEHLGS